MKTNKLNKIVNQAVLIAGECRVITFVLSHIGILDKTVGNMTIISGSNEINYFYDDEKESWCVIDD